MSKRTDELNARIDELTSLLQTEQGGPDPSIIYMNDLVLSINQCRDELKAITTDYIMVK